MKSTLVTLACLSTSALAIAVPQDVDNNDIPSQCTAVCNAVVTLSQSCDRANPDDDTPAHRDCLCNAEGASTVIPTCEACVRQFRPNSDDDNDEPNDSNNDVDDIVRLCSFSTTTYDAAQTSSLTIGSVTGGSTPTGAGGVASTILSGADGVVSTITSGAGGAVSTATAGVGSIASSVSSQVATATDNGGTMPTARVGAGLAAIVGAVAIL